MRLLNFLDEVYSPRRLGIARSTVEQLRTAVRGLDRWAGKPVLLEDLSDDLLCQFLSSLLSSKAPATVNSKRRAILALWTFAHKLKRVSSAPGDIPKVPEPQRLPEAWTVTQVERLLVTCRELAGHVGDIPRRYWWPALVLAVYDTGERIMAVRMTLTVDYNPGERFLVVRAEYQKTRRDRLYWLHDQTVAAIAPIHSRDRSQLFHWPYGRRYFFKYFRRVVERAGLPSSLRGMDLFHRLRRTTISYCAAADEHLAQQQAGHSSLSLTRKSYIDPRIARTRSAVDVLPRPGEH